MGQRVYQPISHLGNFYAWSLLFVLFINVCMCAKLNFMCTMYAQETVKARKGMRSPGTGVISIGMGSHDVGARNQTPSCW